MSAPAFPAIFGKGELAHRPGRSYQKPMTNGIAVWLVLLIGAFLALDHYVLHWDAPLFLARRGLALIEWLAFWR